MGLADDRTRRTARDKSISKNIVLTGFMGTGKSSVGRILARRMRRGFVDLDRYIESSQKRKIRDIFEKDGEAFFRNLEKEAVLFWSQKSDLIITTGGGTVVDRDNFTALKQNGILVTLVARPETVLQRVKNSKNRPLLNEKEDLLAEIRALLEKRKSFYDQSDLFFDTDGQNGSQVARMIQKVIESKV